MPELAFENFVFSRSSLVVTEAICKTLHLHTYTRLHKSNISGNCTFVQNMFLEMQIIPLHFNFAYLNEMCCFMETT